MNGKVKILLLVLIIPVITNAQGLKRKIADKYFIQLDYSKAAPIFDELAEKSFKDSEKKGTQVDWSVVRLAAESNYHALNFKKAGEWYSKLEKTGTMTENEYLLYLDILHYNGNYTEADAIIDKLYAQHADNHRISLFYHNKENRKELMLDSNQFKISKAPFNKNYGDFGPAFYKDGIVYASSRRPSGFINQKYFYNSTNYLDLYYSAKNKNNEYGKSGKILGGVFKTAPHDGPVFFNKENNLAIITRNFTTNTDKGEKVHLKLEIISKDAKGKWGKPVDFPFNNKDYSVGHATLSDDGKTMYFASDMPGGHGGSDIWKTTLENGSWTTPVNLGDEINTSSDEEFPFLFEDHKLYFASDGHFGLGGLDIFVTDISTGEPTEPDNMEYPMNTQYDDFALIVDSTGGAGFFSSSRKDGIDRIYAAQWELPEFDLNGIVVLNNDKKTPLGNTDVIIINNETGVKDSLKADANGEFYSKLHRNHSYSIVANKLKYELIDKASVTTRKKQKSETFQVELVLKQLTIMLNAQLVDKTSGIPLANSKVILTDKTTGEKFDAMTDENGLLVQEVATDHEFEIKGHSHGYLENTIDFNTNNQQGITEYSVKVPLEKIKVGEVFVVNHIYYDYNKFNLRDESKEELDKLAEFLIDNNVKVELSSHTDSRGSDSDNMKLSQKRAQSCVDYLVSKGVPKAHIIAKGYGESKLVNGCSNGVECTEDEHQANRRTEVKILKVY